jgi:quinol monooxygenase YgiN
MTTNVSWLVEANIRPGKFGDFERLMDEMVGATRRNEPKTLNFEWYISDDHSTCHIYERYEDSAAVLTHMASFGKNFAGHFLDCVEPVRLIVYGSPNQEAKDALEGLTPVYMAQINGFAR